MCFFQGKPEHGPARHPVLGTGTLGGSAPYKTKNILSAFSPGLNLSSALKPLEGKLTWQLAGTQTPTSIQYPEYKSRHTKNYRASSYPHHTQIYGEIKIRSTSTLFV